MANESSFFDLFNGQSVEAKGKGETERIDNQGVVQAGTDSLNPNCGYPQEGQTLVFGYLLAIREK